MRNFQVEWLVLAVLVMTHAAGAEPREPAGTPDMELLEFLGSWELENGDSVDPMSLEELDVLDEPGVSGGMGPGADVDRGVSEGSSVRGSQRRTPLIEDFETHGSVAGQGDD